MYVYIYIYIYIHIAAIPRAGQIHLSINNLKTSWLDKFGAILALNGSSRLSERLAFKLLMLTWMFPVRIICIHYI